jgi:hypothetical protein
MLLCFKLQFQVTCSASSTLAEAGTNAKMSSHYEAENTNLKFILACQLPLQYGAQPGAPAVCDDNRAPSTFNAKYDTPSVLLQTDHDRSYPSRT